MTTLQAVETMAAMFGMRRAATIAAEAERAGHVAACWHESDRVVEVRLSNHGRHGWNLELASFGPAHKCSADCLAG